MNAAETVATEPRTAQAAEVERRIRIKARRRVHSKLGFIWHLVIFAMVNTALVVINLNYTPDHRWFVWPLFAWGFGLLAHGLATFMIGGVTEGMVEQEIERGRRRRGPVD